MHQYELFAPVLHELKYNLQIFKERTFGHREREVTLQSVGYSAQYIHIYGWYWLCICFWGNCNKRWTRQDIDETLSQQACILLDY